MVKPKFTYQQQQNLIQRQQVQSMRTSEEAKQLRGMLKAESAIVKRREQ